jgi:hypothetical protein
MSLPIPDNVSDVILIIIFLIPGYFSLRIFRYLAYWKEELSEFDVSLLSILFSGLIYISVALFINQQSIDEFKKILLMPINLIYIIGFTFLIGIIPGYIIRKLKERKHEIFFDVWEAVLNRSIETNERTWVLIYTQDNKEYKGYIHMYENKNENKDITLKNPLMIIRDDDFYIKNEVEMGDEIFFKESDISRIVFIQ